MIALYSNDPTFLDGIVQKRTIPFLDVSAGVRPLTRLRNELLDGLAKTDNLLRQARDLVAGYERDREHILAAITSTDVSLAALAAKQRR